MNPNMDPDLWNDVNSYAHGCAFCGAYKDEHRRDGTCIGTSLQAASRMYTPVASLPRANRIFLMQKMLTTNKRFFTDICDHCGYLNLEHAGEKRWCLFQATTFEHKETL